MPQLSPDARKPLLFGALAVIALLGFWLLWQSSISNRAGAPSPLPSSEEGVERPEPSVDVILIRQEEIVPAEVPPFSENEWFRWSSGHTADANCQVDETVLRNASASEYEDDCGESELEYGVWNDAFTGDVIQTPEEAEVASYVSLRNAHLSGGYKWESSEKMAFANSLSAGYVLAVVRSDTKEKRFIAEDSGLGILAWAPPTSAAAEVRCRYGVNYARTKSVFGLTVTVDEAEALNALLADSCSYPIRVSAEP